MASQDQGRALYFELIKRCLTDSIHADDPLADFVPYHSKPYTPRWRAKAIGALETFLARYRLRLVERHWAPWSQSQAVMSPAETRELRKKGLYYPARCHTLISQQRLDNIQHCVETVVCDDVQGDLIETGVWRGGACILMRAILKAYGDDTRAVWLADSFAGLPPPNEDEFPADAGDLHHTWSDLFAVSRPEVENNFRKYGLLDDQVRFLVGWFKDTLPNAPIERLAVLRLDGDMYESTMQALEGLYHKLSPGGFAIVDDYYLPACARAIHDFRAAHDVTDPIQDIDGRGAFWRRVAG